MTLIITSSSSPRRLLRLCTITAAIAVLLFLPLTFGTNSNSNTALAQPHCDAFTYPNNFNSDWCLYERNVIGYHACLVGNEWLAAQSARISLSPPVQQTCIAPSPPAAAPQPLDCNLLNTCKKEEKKEPSKCVPSLATPRCTQQREPAAGGTLADALGVSSECVNAFFVGATLLTCQGKRCGGMNPTWDNPTGTAPLWNFKPKPIDEWFKQACFGLPTTSSSSR